MLGGVCAANSVAAMGGAGMTAPAGATENAAVGAACWLAYRVACRALVGWAEGPCAVPAVLVGSRAVGVVAFALGLGLTSTADGAPVGDRTLTGAPANGPTKS